MKAYDLSKVSLIMVDDDKFMRSLLLQMLRGLGFKSVMACDGVDAAIDEMRVSAYDIAMIDWVLGGEKSGLDMVKMIRKGEIGERMLPIIMLTANTKLAAVMEARDAGITEFLAKPVSAQTVYSRVVEVIEAPRQFVRTKSYFGPDRRRRKDEKFEGPFRRAEDANDLSIDAGNAKPEPAKV
ncbi:MAG: response regulator [Alphaproteobacteria bacterium]|nr:response regulator [Alphaproteobacteria bacterium]